MWVTLTFFNQSQQQLKRMEKKYVPTFTNRVTRFNIKCNMQSKSYGGNKIALQFAVVVLAIVLSRVHRELFKMNITAPCNNMRT